MVHSWLLLGLALFWQVYHYVLYPLALWLAPARERENPPCTNPTPSVGVIVCAYNERGIIAEKIANTETLSPGAAELVVVTDGSGDGTEDVAKNCPHGNLPLRVLHQPDRKGKSNAMNRAAAACPADILCFTDANAMLTPDALKHIAAEFADPTVAVVSGAKHVHRPAAQGDGSVAAGDGFYWRYEYFIRENESRLGATVAVVGELIAIRREDWVDIPGEVVNDDAWIAMRALGAGHNVRYARRAETWEDASPDSAFEVARRRRINAGRLKLLARRDVWPVGRPWVLIAFLSHKVLRLLLPLLFLVSIVTSLWLWLAAPAWAGLAGLIFLIHAAFAALAGLHPILQRRHKRFKPAAIAFHILSSYGAVGLALIDIARNRNHVLWAKPAR